MRAPAFWWQNPGPRSSLLRPLAAIYGRITTRRMTQPGSRVGIPVVCVGNPTLGGAGKTPTALATAQLLAAAGESPILLSRGYGGTLGGPLLVDPRVHRASEVGDEPLLLARHFPTIVARDRLAGAGAARAAGASVIVMDDGFQNPSLAKDMALLVVDGRRGLGNGEVFPAGPLRAPWASQLACADAIVVVGESRTAIPMRASAKDTPLFSARLTPDAEAVAALRAQPVLAFAGIGDPEKFFRTLDEAGIQAPVRHGFPDHHRYQPAEANRLLAEAERHGLVLLTTEKDRVRLEGGGHLAALRARAQVLPVTLTIDDEVAFAALLRRRIRSA